LYWAVSGLIIPIGDALPDGIFAAGQPSQRIVAVQAEQALVIFAADKLTEMIIVLAGGAARATGVAGQLAVRVPGDLSASACGIFYGAGQVVILVGVVGASGLVQGVDVGDQAAQGIVAAALAKSCRIAA